MAHPQNRRGKPRAKGVVLLPWFLEKVRAIAEERKETLNESLGDLGKRLGEAIGRPKAWDHSAVSRFLNEEVITEPMALAFAELFGIPRPLYAPRTFDEALGMQQVFRRHEGLAINPDQKRRRDSMDQVAEVAEEEIRDQSRGVRSKDEGAGRRGRAGRAPRGRSPTS